VKLYLLGKSDTPGAFFVDVGVSWAAHMERSGVAGCADLECVSIHRAENHTDSFSIAFSDIFLYYIINMLTPLPVRTARSG
jgi:hypothetical protein